MIERRATLTIKNEMDLLDDESLTPLLQKAILTLSSQGFDIYDFGFIFYVINKGQTGTEKIMKASTYLQEAKDFLNALDEKLKPHSEIRVGLIVEGYPLTITKKG